MTTTKKQWTAAYNELVDDPENYSGVRKSNFKTAKAAEEAFTELAAGLGISWSVALEGDIVLEEPETSVVEQGATHPGGEEQFGTDIGQETAEVPPPASDDGAGEKAPGRRARESDTDVIAVLVPNPKRPNSLSFARFAIYTTGITVAEFLARGGRRADLKWDADHEFIRLYPDAATMSACADVVSSDEEETGSGDATADA